MGQKVNHTGRSAANRDRRSKWFAGVQESTDHLHSDIRIREYLKRKLQFAGIAKIQIERAWNRIRVTIFTALPHLVMEKGGVQIELMKADISEMSGGRHVKIDAYEIKSPYLNAQLVAETVAVHIERRVSFRRAMKRAVQTSMKSGALGIRIRVAGRLGGADIARAEWYCEGKVPLQAIGPPLDYGFAEARTVYGRIGIKVWINKPIDNKPEARSETSGRKRKQNVLPGKASEPSGDVPVELLRPGDSLPTNLVPTAVASIAIRELSLLIPGVSAPVPVADLEALFDGWNATNQRRFDLITREAELTAPEREQLARLQNLAEAKAVLTMPLPFARLKEIEAMLPPNAV